MKKNKYIGILMGAAMMLTASSCSEFDDYNKAVVDTTVSGNQTLWENIQQNSELSDFAELIKKSGFDSELSQTQYYTVWAPLNGKFDPTPFKSMSQEGLMRQFVKNHIASYGHQAAGKLNERVLMLNEKTYDFTGNSDYTFDGVSLASVNQPSTNGVLHTLNGLATFYPNLYEYVTDVTMSEGKDIDSLRNFFLRAETNRLDMEHSVPGAIVDGMQTYVDSVIITENSLWETLRIKMANEDSSYTMLMPTNKAWKGLYDKITSSYNYIPTTAVQQYNAQNQLLNTPLTITMDNAFWKDSIANRFVSHYLTYSNANAYNKKLLESNPTFSATDSLYTTTRQKLSNPEEILSYATDKVKMSNGTAYIVDSLAMHPWETYSEERDVSATLRSNILWVKQTTGNQGVTVEVANPDPQKVDLSKENSNTYRYLYLQASTAVARPTLAMYLPNVLSTTYEFYCIFVPENVDKDNASKVTLPNRVNFTLSYCDEDGKLKDYIFYNNDQENRDWFKKEFPTVTDDKTIRGFSNDTAKVDTMFIGEFTFPVCYYGLGTGYCPNIQVSTPFSPAIRTLANRFARDFRIAGFILKPKELVEFEEKNKQ